MKLHTLALVGMFGAFGLSAEAQTCGVLCEEDFLEKAELKKDKDGNDRSPYSLRHYALQTRLVKSDGKVNIYWLAENAGTSVDQLERLYLKNLAPSSAKVRNIQSFGDK